MLKASITRVSKMKVRTKMPHFLLVRTVLISSLISVCFGQTTLASNDEMRTVSSTQTTSFMHFTKRSAKLLESTVVPTTATSNTKESAKTTKAYVASESPATVHHSTAKVYTSTKGVVKSARRQKLNTSSSGLAGPGAHSPARLQERLGAIDCDLPVLPNESRLWRGNETHELNLPVTVDLIINVCDFVVRMTEECGGVGSRGAGGTTPGAAPAAEEECPPVIVSWEGFADIQNGDILIVRIADSLLLKTFGQQQHYPNNSTLNANSSHVDVEREHRGPLQPTVYQVTRQGHEHCDVTDGTLLDITPLDEGGAKLFTLYDKDLNEGVNLFIVVSKNWGSQCVRLKVTVKSDNCGESQDCSGKGVCYTNVSMEGYECQCCADYVGPHCEERWDACNPSPCLNNGICVYLTQPLNNGANYHCLCPYGFTGRKCEKDPCSSGPCLNGGSCMSMAMNGTTTFHCACADGWTGAHCELSVTGGACASSPCVKGICVEQIDNDIRGEEYRCFCEPGYTGIRCEMEYNECESSPCANGGTCTDRISGYTCACGRGYTGNTCQLKVDLCSPNPCPDHRYCVDRGNSYECECPRGYVGDECHLPARSPCDDNPCAHGGTCWSDVDSFYCSCRPGYTGKLCEDLLVDAESNLNSKPDNWTLYAWTPTYLSTDLEDFILESVVGGEVAMEPEPHVGVREVRLPLGLYHDRLHNVYIAAGTLGAAIAIVGVVVTACHCRVNKTYSRLLSRLSRASESGPPHHWLQDKRAPPTSVPFPPPTSGLDTTDMYYTLDFSDSQSSPLIQ